ncbi:hypothetical protein [Dactylosporangium sp. NPDC048998]|uniref:hypothetical protein n=1 Tax=Dactylosporangium sp. NPDC048998 TaxID=3363976 RepID=UPI0037189D7B
MTKVAVAMTLLATVISATAQAAVARTTAASQTICFNTPPPTGWMITAYYDSNTCGTPGSVVYNAKSIVDVQGTPAGGRVNACQMPPPSGFYATSWSYSFSCEASKTPNRLFNNLQVVTNLNGLPSGTSMVICGIQDAPAGWVLVAVVSAYQCIYVNGGGLGQNAVSIRKS